MAQSVALLVEKLYEAMDNATIAASLFALEDAATLPRSEARRVLRSAWEDFISARLRADASQSTILAELARARLRVPDPHEMVSAGQRVARAADNEQRAFAALRDVVAQICVSCTRSAWSPWTRRREIGSELQALLRAAVSAYGLAHMQWREDLAVFVEQIDTDPGWDDEDGRSGTA